MQQPAATVCVALVGLMVTRGTEARAQVGGATFTLVVASPVRGISGGTLTFDDTGGFLFLSQTGSLSSGTYAETVDDQTGESSLTLTAGTTQPISGIAVASTRHATVNGALPLTLLFGFSYGGGNRFYVFVGYYFPTIPVAETNS